MLLSIYCLKKEEALLDQMHYVNSHGSTLNILCCILAMSRIRESSPVNVKYDSIALKYRQTKQFSENYIHF